MNAVGIDVSKGKSTVAVLRPFGEIVVSPFDVSHSPKELSKLVTLLKTLNGDTKVVMEYTGNYYLPIALFLRNNGFFVSVVNPILVKDYSTKSLTVRKVKTDKKMLLKLLLLLSIVGMSFRRSPLNPKLDFYLNPTIANTINTTSSKLY